jgi:hypothetical protein
MPIALFACFLSLSPSMREIAHPARLRCSIRTRHDRASSLANALRCETTPFLRLVLELRVRTSTSLDRLDRSTRATRESRRDQRRRATTPCVLYTRMRVIDRSSSEGDTCPMPSCLLNYYAARGRAVTARNFIGVNLKKPATRVSTRGNRVPMAFN